jgi:benzoyl-CoA reductase/2-hydroxyglutaryl-CoA dehydratase subunit BcrC/BadD/HgdB
MRIPTRKETVDSLRHQGRPIAAVLPIHYPRELVRACGLHPMEVWGPAGVDPVEADAHFQSYTCAIVRNATAFLLRGKLDAAAAVVVPHTCDALQGMASVLRDFVDTRQPVLTLYLPRGDRACDEDYLVAELRRLARRLSEISGVEPSDEKLLEAVVAEEEADAAFADLAHGRDGIALDDRSFFTLLRSREYLSPAGFVELARSAPRGARDDRGARLMISGIVPEPMEIFDRVSEMGGQVVADDLACCSRRIYPGGTGDDPWKRMVQRLMRAPPDPTRGTPLLERAAWVEARMRESKAEGLIVYDVKFCEPELFDLPKLEEYLVRAGFPVLHLEVDLSAAVSQQTVTRIETFVEMLQ